MAHMGVSPPMLDTKRREFIALVGGGGLLLAVKVKRAWGRQPAMPVIGFLGGGTQDTYASYVDGFRRGLVAAGRVEGRDATIELHWLEGRYDRAAVLAEQLVRRAVAVIVVTGCTAVVRETNAAAQ